MKKKNLKSALCCFLAALSLLPSLAFGSLDVKASEWAEDDIVNLDNTTIASDLSDINPDEMKKMFTSQDVALIRFQEYCYSMSFYADAYALYLYIYNPSGKQVMDNDCVINMATEFNADGEATAYSNVKLTLLDTAKSNTFLKFKVSDTYRTQIYDMEKSYAETHNGVRKYNISGITLYFKDGTSAKEYDISNTYEVSGYAVDMNGNDTSTLDMSALETITLDVKHTNYRTEAYENCVCDEINTVYFTVPMRYFDEYGNIQAISAEWYEYKSSPIFVTKDTGWANNKEVKSKIGQTITEVGNGFGYRVFWDETDKYDATQQVIANGGDILQLDLANRFFNGGYNALGLDESCRPSVYTTGKYYVNRLDWLFLRENVEEKEDMYVSSDELLSYLQVYTNTHQNTDRITIPTSVGSKSYSANLFAESIDTDRIEKLTDKTNPRGGHVLVNTTIDKGEDITVKKDNYDWWDKVCGRNPNTSDTFYPIKVFEAEDISTVKNMSADEFCERYYVGGQRETDKTAIKNWVENNYVSGSQGRKPVFFHFAVTDYYHSIARFDLDAGRYGDDSSISPEDGYVAQETFFFNFDILSLTFRNEKGDTVIPVESNPFDIVNDVTTNHDFTKEDWWDKIKQAFKILFIILVVAVVIGILSPFLPFIFGLIFWVIKLPFKLLAMLFKAIGKLFKKKKK